MKKVTLSTCSSCKGKSDALKKIKGVDKVETESSSLVVIGKFDVDDILKTMHSSCCHHSVLRSVENNYEEKKKEEKKKDEKKDEKSVIYVYTHNFNYSSK